MDIDKIMGEIFKDMDIEKTLGILKKIGEMLECPYIITEHELKKRVQSNLEELKADPEADAVGSGFLQVNRLSDCFVLNIDIVIATTDFTASNFQKD